MACFRRSATSVSLINLIIALLQVIAGINGFFYIPNLITFNLAGIFISAYAVITAMPLFLYECKIKRCHSILRRQVGFMFHFYGRCIYLVFLAFLDVGIPGGFGLIIAILIGMNLFFMLSLRCCGVPLDEKRPLHSNAHENYQTTGVISPQHVAQALTLLQ
ncbi:unnamed protein product [Aphanomyces euteiches]